MLSVIEVLQNYGCMEHYNNFFSHEILQHRLGTYTLSASLYSNQLSSIPRAFSTPTSQGISCCSTGIIHHCQTKQTYL